MATEEQTKPLIESIDKALGFQKKDMISRSEWGSITFDKAKNDLDRIFAILSHLKLLPLEHLTDQAITQINSQLNEVIKHLESIDSFNIEQANPPQIRDNLVAAIHQQADQFYTVATPWIPFLAYQKGDVSKNIEVLTKSVQDANEIVEKAKEDIERKEEEIQEIITKAREASAAAGAAVFTKDFLRESDALRETAMKWLIATAIFALLTAGAAGAMWYWVEPGLDNSQLLQKFGSKLAVLAVLFTATMWCGRIYRALMHQSSTNRHRGLSLQTFQAFSSAAADPQTKEAVLLETTRAIFSSSPSGYIESKSGGNEQDVRIIELAKSPAVVRVAEDVAKNTST